MQKYFTWKYQTVLYFLYFLFSLFLYFLCSCSYLFKFLLSSQFYWHIGWKPTAYFFDPPGIHVGITVYFEFAWYDCAAGLASSYSTTSWEVWSGRTPVSVCCRASIVARRCSASQPSSIRLPPCLTLHSAMSPSLAPNNRYCRIYLFIYFFIKYMTVCLTDSHTARTTKTVTAALNTNTRHKTVYI